VSQYDVFDNPIPQARRAFPFVVVLQSELADTGGDRIVAALVPRTRMMGTIGRLTPVVKVAGVDHVLLIPRMTAVAAADLRVLKDTLIAHRGDIVAALDYLFIGV
jgi:toxin CcdB